MPRPSPPNKEPQLVDHINDSDDEEIDEDEAFNSEDELMYGSFWSGGSKKTSKKKGGKKLKSADANDDDEDDDDSDESVDSEDDGEGEADSDDDDDDNDWAGSSDDSDDQDDDGGQYMLDLLNKLDDDMDVKPPSKPGGGGGKISLTSAAAEAAVRLQESEFYSGALSGMSSSNIIDDKLTLDSLMGDIADTAGFASVQKSMRALSSSNADDTKRLQTTSAPVSRVVSDRASRKVHYQSTSEDVTLWKEAIHEQRDAETLDFRTNKGGATTNRITRDTLVDKFEATNDFEKELQLALEKAGMEDEQKMLQREKKRLTGEVDEENAGDGEHFDDDDDDLGSNRISMEEYKKRHGELAKLRALMFYEEQKRHRINKIKSKKYRKIRKRQRERQQNAEEEARRLEDDGALDRERQEQEEMDRMKERMTLAHKNTSKWARRMLRRGSKMDVEERRALSLQIAKGEELRRKMMGEDDDDDEESGSENRETEEDLLKRARDILMEDDDVMNEEDGNSTKKKKGLLNMEFMKRGMEAQRARARDEARKLLEELEANEIEFMASNSEDENNDEQISLAKKTKTRVATEAEINEILPEGTMVASSLQFGKADGFSIKVDGDIKLSSDNRGIEADDMQAESRMSKKKRKKQRDASVEGDVDVPQSADVNNADVEEENPWITSKSTQKSSKSLSRVVNIDKAASMLVDDEQVMKSAKRKRDDDDIQDQSQEENPDSTNKDVGIAELSQAELVRRAFAAPADLEAEEEFMKEKVRIFCDICSDAYAWITLINSRYLLYPCLRNE